ncbi:CheR family methyltransferase [Arthrobacter sp. AL12]|uniref:CheR family methyltransferase n=1 Tax=Arthrobacter sp. AL12 TaxID=3042241 RepID=UPI00249A1A0E|nr:CheR family methyltransferase [Arthrobacter sp. AL12]MDI3210497.1 CheR family methyltransferase [Arthrobacter sp. AL12]
MTDWARDPELWPGFLEFVPPNSRVWCAGIATGEEVITLAARTPESVSIIATDIRPDALEACEAGKYPKAMVDAAIADGDFTQEDARRAFLPSRASDAWLQVTPAILERITWARGDLIRDLYPEVELIFCRNTLHMIPAEDRASVVRRLAHTRTPVIIGKSDFQHMHQYWAEEFQLVPSLILS